ncbi:NACHT domain-containing protein [Nostoc sp. 'Peltigera membranacea cyanobiont' N6]|uniref:NACHT domain-containing protein n=1 Tax=Nostoc sp. 'Peltigera membranacea cyanobiont' N6 TaxID=1261031 RepID=UPI000CF339D0|nr:NACHT domain-containing protein [Nostoc sp. 'Peltigera membranacea cyanobiont' N6]AVH63763.1 NACHT family NTPase [Nostoc sp. 'Peltigera membranacea cyanobiont' N6]
MTRSDELVSILDRILDGCGDEGDVAILRQSLKASGGQNVVQLGKYNVNIGEGKDIHIGDKVYQGADAQTIRSIFLEVLSHNTRQLEIDWHNISQAMLSEQQRLTTNPLTSGEGITYRTEQVYVPLGLVERKKLTRRREDVSPEQGSELDRETEITQTFEHQQFLEQVLRQRQSPKSQGRRIAIIGEPGAGKTTLLQQIAQWTSAEMGQSVVIWVSLADLQGRELESYLLEVWLQAVARKVGQAEASTQVQDDFVAQFNQGLVWLLLDGVDEMQATVGNPLGEIERQIRTGTLLQQARIVLSCRLNLWDSGSNALDSFDNYRTLEFCYPQQVEQFIGNWFGSLPSAETQTGQRLCAALREAGKERIRDLVKNPLRLTLLCFNWYLGEGKLPETKAGLYEQFMADFYEWKKGQFATTGEQRKRLNAALGELAREAIDKEATRFRLRQEFVCEYLGEPDDADSLFGLALRLGWLNKVGVEAENPRKGVYGFFHPTFQEYFAALAIDDWHYFLNHIPDNPSHPDANYRIFEPHWKEIFLFWMGQSSPKIQEHKVYFIYKLVGFDDRCGGLYAFKAYFLAAEAMGEFKTHPSKIEIFYKIFEWSFGIYKHKENKWQDFIEPLMKTAKLTLLRIDQDWVMDALKNTIVSIEKNQIYRLLSTLEEFGKINPKALFLLLFKIIYEVEEYSIIDQAISIIERIYVYYSEVEVKLLTKYLLEIAEKRQEANIAWRIFDCLAKIGTNQPLLMSWLSERCSSIMQDMKLIDTEEAKNTYCKAAETLITINPSNLDAIQALLQIVASGKYENNCRRAAEALMEVETESSEVVEKLKQLVQLIGDDSIHYILAESLGNIALKTSEAFTALTELAKPIQADSIRLAAAYGLTKIAPDLAMEVLVQIINSTQDETIKTYAVQSLGETYASNLNNAPVLYLEIYLDSIYLHLIKDCIHFYAIGNLGETAKNYPKLMNELVYLVNSCQDNYVKYKAAEALEKIEPGRSDVTQALIENFMSGDNNFIDIAASSLMEISKVDQLYQITSVMKSYLTPETYQNDISVYHNACKIIWHCAQNLSYPEFYNAWNNQLH